MKGAASTAILRSGSWPGHSPECLVAPATNIPGVSILNVRVAFASANIELVSVFPDAVENGARMGNWGEEIEARQQAIKRAHRGWIDVIKLAPTPGNQIVVSNLSFRVETVVTRRESDEPTSPGQRLVLRKPQ